MNIRRVAKFRENRCRDGGERVFAKIWTHLCYTEGDHNYDFISDDFFRCCTARELDRQRVSSGDVTVEYAEYSAYCRQNKGRKEPSSDTVDRAR